MDFLSMEELELNNEIQVLIIEDEPFWSSSLATSLADFGYGIAGIAGTFGEAVEVLNKENYDIVLLDINLHGKNQGLELGQMISRFYKKPFIYITGGNPGYTMEDVLQTRPSAYLMKPFNAGSLLIAIQNAIANFSADITPANTETPKEPSFLFVKQGVRYKKIEWKDVVFLKSTKNYAVLYNATDKQEYYVRSTLQKIMKFIIPSAMRGNFVQMNRGEAVQIEFIREFTYDEIRTDYGTFTVTENYIGQLKKQLRLL